ncbi:response regulator transcription factor [Phytohalomonas tamaricis]|uniref:response regulator transcription factor n=1 Tax=Phytohalomonas tamaricis TaxID=2081032 RepID=UPI0021D455C0|nr:response regulator transcription factor [Phytohalomonas tamaricis]
MELTTVKIVMMTKSSPQNALFLDYLHTRLGCQVSSILPTDVLPLPEETPVLVLLDEDHLRESDTKELSEKFQNNKNLILAAFNMDSEDHAMELMLRLPLQGVFYRQDSLEHISKGIKRLFDGEMWLSRSLMERLLTAYWSRQRNDFTPLSSVTAREWEILNLLDTGASNLDIAERLSISEHTVKSHLYHIFRKLKVRNRAQALNLLRQYSDTTPKDI